MPDNSKEKQKHRITLVDVAKDAGVSRATASLVVRDSPRVADATRQKVLASIDKLGYVYNRGAAKLRTQQSHTIGLVVTDIRNPFYAELTVGAEEQLEQTGYVVLLANTSDSSTKQASYLETVLEHGVDGLLLCSATDTSRSDIEFISRQIPVVQFVRRIDGIELDYVGADHTQGTQMAVEHLIEHGHERIAYIGGPVQSSARLERINGYQQALAQHDLSIDNSIILPTGSGRQAGYEAILHLLETPHPPTAVMCYNDVIAFGVMLGLQSRGMVPAHDIAVIGFDNIADAETWHPRLTSVSGDPIAIGEHAVNRLLARIHNPELEIEEIILPTSLVIRDSCGTQDRYT